MLLDEDLLRLSLERNDCAGLVLGHLASGRNLLMIGRLASPGRIWKRRLRFTIQFLTAPLSARRAFTPT
jgi:hypothetical protein